MSYNQKKFLDANGLTHFIKILDNYPTNEILDTVINAIQSSIDNIVIVSDTQPTATDNKIWIKPSVQDTVQVPTVEEMNQAIAAVDVPVQDVQVNGTSILNNGVANVPYATQNAGGVVKIIENGSGGFQIDQGFLLIRPATNYSIKLGNRSVLSPIVPGIQDISVFYGLAKAAGDTTMASSSNSVGTYTPEAKGAIQKMLGVSDLIGPEENNLVASQAYQIGEVFTANGKLYKATAAIAADAAIIPAVEGEEIAGANCEETSVGEGFVKKTDYVSSANQTAGIVGVTPLWSGIKFGVNGMAQLSMPADGLIKQGIDTDRAILIAKQHLGAFYGLAKAAGADEKDSALPVGQYTDNAKTAIRAMIGAAASGDGSAAPVQDVQVNGTSILSNKIANIPIASSTKLGVVKVGSGLYIDDGAILPNFIGESNIKKGNVGAGIISSARQHISTFYGLAKAAGADEKDSTLPLGTYTDTAKIAIRSMLGATSSNVIAVQDTQPTDTDTKIWLPETAETPVQIPTMEDLGSYVQKTDYATTDEYGLVKVGSGLYIGGSTGKLAVAYANSASIKNATNATASAPVSLQHESVFYGLAKASGDATQSASSNAVGTYTDEAKSSIRTMLGAGKVDNVQINGTSILNNGTANIPIASGTSLGVVKVNGHGLFLDNGLLNINYGSSDTFRAGTHTTALVPANLLHAATFYGLAKAAGDTTQAASSNAVGNYTIEAQTAIQSMLGVENGVSFVETVSGTAPVITGEANTRYVCGEVLTISITPPNIGTIDVVFISGTTPTVLTIPSTVKFPVWFDATALEANTTYELLITDGIYGGVMTWAN